MMSGRSAFRVPSTRSVTRLLPRKKCAATSPATHPMQMNTVIQSQRRDRRTARLGSTRCVVPLLPVGLDGLGKGDSFGSRLLSRVGSGALIIAPYSTVVELHQLEVEI